MLGRFDLHAAHTAHVLAVSRQSLMPPMNLMTKEAWNDDRGPELSNKTDPWAVTASNSPQGEPFTKQG